MVILSVGLTPPKTATVLEKVTGITRSPDGYFASVQPEVLSVVNPTKGIFIAGAAEAAKDIPDSIAQASAAAMKAAIVTSKGKGDGSK